jgi:hypothetical protein
MKKFTLPVIIGSFLVLSQAVVIARGTNSWPFTNYEMFSQKKSLSETGAYRLRVQLQNGSYRFLPLDGNKANWFVYEEGVKNGNVDVINERLNKNLADYLKNHDDLKKEDIVEVSLINTSLAAKSDGHGLEMANDVLHSMRPNAVTY